MKTYKQRKDAARDAAIELQNQTTAIKHINQLAHVRAMPLLCAKINKQFKNILL